MISELISFVTFDKIIYVSLSACVITTIYIKNKNDNIVMNLGWEAMRILTRLQMLTNNMTSWCCDYDNSIKTNKHIFTVVKDGKEIEEFAIEKELTSAINEKCKKIKDYEFIYKTVNDMSSQLITIRENPELLHNSECIDVPLLMAAIKHNNKEHLVTNLKSFFILDNKLFNRSFVQWYLNKYYHKNIFDEDYTVVLFTTSGSPVTLNKCDELIIKKDGYKIIYDKKICTDTTTGNAWRGLDESDIPDEDANITPNCKGNQTSLDTSDNLSVPSTPPSSSLSPFIKPENGESPSPLSLKSQATDKSYDVVNDIQNEEPNEELNHDDNDNEKDNTERLGPKEKGFWSWFI